MNEFVGVQLEMLLFFAGVIILLGTSVYCIFLRKKKDCANLLPIKAHYQKVFENTQDIICLALFEPKFHFEYIHPSIASLSGHAPQDFYLAPELFHSHIHPDDLLFLDLGLKKAATDFTNQPISLRFRKPGKSFAHFELDLIPLFEHNKICAGFCLIARKDNSNQGLLENPAHLERLHAISQMASSVAHEIRNPMTTVKGYLQFFSEKPEFNQYREQFDLIIDELDRANLIIKEYLALNQNKMPSLRLCQLNNIIASLYPLLKADANNKGKDIQIYLNNLPELLLDENEIRQLVLNIVKNGLESMLEMKDRTVVSISTYLENDEAVMHIKDQGAGISPDILANIGQPLLTTKEQGTGLGLTVCYQIAAKHNAQIKVDTNHDGTGFFVKFPLAGV